MIPLHREPEYRQEVEQSLREIEALYHAAPGQARPGPPRNLRCEHLRNPLGMDERSPRLSWQLQDPRRGARQSARRIQVAADRPDFDTPEGLVWDSGRVEGDENCLVPYEGPALESRRRYHWRVRVWDAQGEPGPWSEPAWWECGLLEPGDWQARWIGAPPEPEPEPLPLGQRIWHPEAHEPWQHCFFEKRFTLPAGVAIRRARLESAAAVISVVQANEHLVGGSDGLRRARFELGDRLRPGDNRLRIEVRNHNGPGGLAAALRVEFDNGETLLIQTDTSWRAGRESRACNGPVLLHLPQPDPGHWCAAAVLSLDGEAAEPWEALQGCQATPLPAPRLRHAFRLKARPRRARAYVCGLGFHEFHANGKRLGDAVLEPAQTDYDKRCFYVVHDLTEALREGENAIGIQLADGWYHQNQIWGGLFYGLPRALAQIEIEYEDGSRETIASDADWLAGQGPLRQATLYQGETWDARLEEPGWCAPGFDSSAWSPAALLEAPGGDLLAQNLPPIRRTQTLPCRVLRETAPGVWLFDAGQNITGWARLRVEAPAGTEIEMRFAEITEPDGRLSHHSVGLYHTHVYQQDRYICRGAGLETWEPRFTYHGFRYVELRGLPAPPTDATLEAVVVHSAVADAGHFEASEPLVNEIHQLALWTEVNNLHSIPTDCPHRERCGWLGDAHVRAETAIFNFDMAAFWSKWLGDIATTLIDGQPAMIAPGKRLCGMATGDWGTAMVQLPWYLYLYYGDRRPLEQWLPRWRPWLDKLRRQAGDDLILESEQEVLGLGDWCPPGQNEAIDTPVPLSSTVYFHRDAWIAARAAELLGHADEAREYDALARDIRQAFIQRFFDPQAGSFGSQTANALALCLDLAPEGREADLANAIARDAEARGHGISTGIMGLRYLFQALADHGREDEARRLLLQTRWPSIGWLRTIDATTLWEAFGVDGNPEERPYYSLSHPMQGGYDAWFYNGLGGMRPRADAPGFRHFTLQPALTGEIDSARALHLSPHGPILSQWNRTGRHLHWRIVVPPGCRARATFPAPPGATLNEGGRPALQAPGVTPAPPGQDRLCLDLEAGPYAFSLQLEA